MRAHFFNDKKSDTTQNLIPQIVLKPEKDSVLQKQWQFLFPCFLSTLGEEITLQADFLTS